MANFSFDSTNIQPATLRTIPEGIYLAKIVNSDLKNTKNKTGKYLELTFEIIKGEYAGRKIKSRLNIINQNETAQQIALKQLSAICHAVNVISFTATEQLHNLPLDIVVTNRVDDITGKTYADVSEYMAASELPQEPGIMPPKNVPQFTQQPVQQPQVQPQVSVQPVQQPVNVEQPQPQVQVQQPQAQIQVQAQQQPIQSQQPVQQPQVQQPIQPQVQAQHQQEQPTTDGSTVPPWVNNGQ